APYGTSQRGPADNIQWIVNPHIHLGETNGCGPGKPEPKGVFPSPVKDHDQDHPNREMIGCVRRGETIPTTAMYQYIQLVFKHHVPAGPHPFYRFFDDGRRYMVSNGKRD